jgi:HEAT repeat protein
MNTRSRRVTRQLHFRALAVLLPLGLCLVCAGPARSADKTLSDAEIKTALADLKSPNADTRKAAAERLAKAEPDSAHRTKVATALEAGMVDPSIFARGAIAKALGSWGGDKNVQPMIVLLSHKDIFIRGAAMEVLGALKNERGSRAVAMKLESGSDRGGAGKALKAMGPVAEKAVIPYTRSADAATRAEACHVLKEIGGSASVKPLQVVSRDPDPKVASAAKEALDTVKGR